MLLPNGTTIVEAILEHGTDDPADISEAHNSRRAYLGRSASDKKARKQPVARAE